MYYTVCEVAKRLDLSPHTIRFYGKEGLDVLKYKTRLYETALEAGTTAIHDNMPPDEMPPHIRRIKERIRRLTDDMETRYKEASRN